MISYFLGANTPRGFYSLYEDLIPRAEARAVYILKGGPGCGKSTLMKKTAAAAEAAGERVEAIRCSGDPDSLDALLLPDRGAALVDGTAPHVVEPVLPGAVDHYVDLGACYDAAALADLREELSAAMSGYRDCYDRAYRCLAAAEEIRVNCRSRLSSAWPAEKWEKRLRGILDRELRGHDGGEGRVTRRFLSAVTCQGRLCLWETVTQQCGKIYVLEDSYGFAHRLLLPVVTAAAAAGQDVVVCLSPLDPERVEHVLLPGLSLAFVTASPALPFPGKACRRLRLDSLPDRELLRQLRPGLRFAQKVSDALIREAVGSLAEAKAMHDALEGLYNPHVDFARVDAIADEVISRLALV